MSVYDYSVKKADGSTVSLRDYKGKALLIVNTASFCGYTKQLLGLEKMYEAYKDRGLEILAFPVNQFLDQEPDNIDIIVDRYHDEYGVTFPIMGKVLANGDGTDPLFTYLKGALPFDPNSNTPEAMIPHYKNIDPNYESNSDIKWNFTKFLVDQSGNPVKRFEPEETPSHLYNDLDALLK